MNNRSRVHSFATDCQLHTAEYEGKLSDAKRKLLACDFSGLLTSFGGLTLTSLAESAGVAGTAVMAEGAAVAGTGTTVASTLGALLAANPVALTVGSSALVGISGYLLYECSKVIYFLINMLYIFISKISILLIR